jgi:thiol:disulfide interchange protein DsbA
VDPIAFETAWHSREVAKAMDQANAIVNAYGVTSVPQFGVAGLYRTSPTMAGGSNARVLEVVTYLLEQVRHS